MKIGIIGAGNMGTGIGKYLARAGHEIVVSFGRSDDAVRAAADAIGGGARAGTPDEAARASEVVLLATPWGVTLDAVRGIAAALDGKILWDTTNPLKPDFSGLEVGTTTSAGEEVAKAAPGAKVVKAIAPFAEVLRAASPLIDGRRPGVFVCGDDAAARSVVLALVGDIGAEGVEAGPLANARYTELAGMSLVQLAYVHGMGARIGSVLNRETSSA